jgi:hypothetical protein
MAPKKSKVSVNRAPVLTLWAAVVAERLGHDRPAALTLGKSVAGLNAQSKGRRLGIYEETDEEAEPKEKKPAKPGQESFVKVLGREVPVVTTKDGVRATAKGQPIDPHSVERYLRQKFGEDLDEVQAALWALARAFPPRQLESRAYALYEQFRPEVPEGKTGWGAKGDLSLTKIRKLAEKKP